MKEQELPPKSTSSDPPPSNTFQKAKQARESQKPSRVGGGIFRASGDNTIFKGSTNASAPTPKSPAEPPKPATSSSPSKSSPPAEPVQSTALEPSQLAETDPAPKTLFDLVRAWHKSNDEAMQYRLIMASTRSLLVCGRSPTDFLHCRVSLEIITLRYSKPLWSPLS